MVGKVVTGRAWLSSVHADYVGQYNPSAIKHSVRKKMRLDPQLALGLAALKAPVMGAFNAWHIECVDQDINDFVVEVLGRILPSLLRTSLCALDFGHSPHEKLWQVEDVPVLRERRAGRTEKHTFRGANIYHALKDIYPGDVVYFVNQGTDEFAGFKHRGDDKQFVPAAKAFVVTHGKEWGGLYGTSMLDRTYDAWYWCTIMHYFTNRYYERRADPPYKGRAPQVAYNDEGVVCDGIDKLSQALLSLRSDGHIVLPSEWNADAGDWDWDIEVLKDDQRGVMFIRYLDYLQALKLRGLFVPERTLTQDSAVGSLAMARAHTQTFFYMLSRIVLELLEHYNRYLVRPLVVYNFGSKAPKCEMKAEIEVREHRDDILRLMSAIIDAETTIGTGNQFYAHELVDVQKILRALNIPVLKPLRSVGEVAPSAEPRGSRETQQRRRALVKKLNSLAKKQAQDIADQVLTLAEEGKTFDSVTTAFSGDYEQVLLEYFTVTRGAINDEVRALVHKLVVQRSEILRSKAVDTAAVEPALLRDQAIWRT